jgi:hypothetical protein
VLARVLAGAETFVDIARFGQKKIAFLRRFLPFRDGTPSHDHLGDIFAVERQSLKKLAIDEHALQGLLNRWRAEAEKNGHRITRIAVAFEVGHDGFWLARWRAAVRSPNVSAANGGCPVDAQDVDRGAGTQAADRAVAQTTERAARPERRPTLTAPSRQCFFAGVAFSWLAANAAGGLSRPPVQTSA